MMTAESKDAIRLINKAVVIAESGCWVWMGNINRNGYGRVKRNKCEILAHRHAFTVFVGAIPDGMLVCHACDVRCCINPNHLWLGTNLANMQDMAKKERGVCPDRSGSRNGRAKLSEWDVRYIRQSSASTRRLSTVFDVSVSAVSDISSGRSWSTLS